MRKQFYQHREVISELRMQLLLLSNLCIVKDVASMLVHEVKVCLAKDLDLDEVGAVVRPHDADLDLHCLGCAQSTAMKLFSKFRVDHVKLQRYHAVKDKAISTDFNNEQKSESVRKYLLKLGSV